MKLTITLLRRNLLPNGHIYRGKDRLVKRVQSKHLRNLEQDFAVEEQNMFYLRQPYLTEAESLGHSKALGKQEQRIKRLEDVSRRIFKADVTIYERLKHLRVNESWD